MTPTPGFRFEADWADADSDTFQLDALEGSRQLSKIVLTAAVSLCPRAVRQALASSFGNIDAEGYPPLRLSREEEQALSDAARQLAYYRRYSDNRFNRSTEFANLVEVLAQRRMGELFATDSVPARSIFVNVQPPTGALANLAAFDALLEPGDAIVAMALGDGGHLTHGSPFHRSARYYSVTPYGIDPQTGRLDYDAIEAVVRRVRPRLLIGGASSYPWAIEWATLREILDRVSPDTYLMADIAHPAGLVAAGLFPNPIGYADVTTLVTYKTLCGPRGAAILTTDERLAQKIDRAVFPRLQGAPIFQNILAMAVGLRIARSDSFGALQRRIVANAQALAGALQDRGLTLAYHGTSTHLVVVDLRPLAGAGRHPLKGDAAARILDACGILCNKNTLPGDASAADANGLRFGTTWVSQLGMDPPAMSRLAAVVHRILTHIQPFSYSGLRLEEAGDPPRARTLPRGKIDHGVMQEARASVQQLLRQFSPAAPTPPGQQAQGARPARLLEPRAAETPAGALWLAGAAQTLSVLEITGERARPFLQAVGTADVFNLPTDRPARLTLLDPAGRPLADALLTRLAADALGQDRFLLTVPHPQLETVTAWLRDLSDGYVLFGGPDILAKVDGPVVVEPMRPLSGDERQAVLLLGGGQARSIFQDSLSLPESWAEGQWQSGQWANAPIELTWFADHSSAQPVFVLRLPLAAVPEAVRQLQAAAGQHPGALTLCEPEPPQADPVEHHKPFWIGMAASPSSPPGPIPTPAFQPPPPTGARQRTPLFDEHRQCGAKMSAFAGWEMPLWYTRISEEYGAVRRQAALFDLAHMGILEITGEDAVWYLDAVTTNYVPALHVGQGAYSFLLNPDGSVLDDCYLYRLARQQYWLVANAANADRVRAWLQAVRTDPCAIEPGRPAARVLPRAAIRDLKDRQSGSDRRINLGVQGPQSLLILQSLAHSALQKKSLAALKRNEALGDVFQGFDLIVARTGYTGERVGFELYVHPDCAVDLWRCLLRLGEPHGLRPAGLGARDAARIEAGFPLHGHELAGPSQISPLGAGYGAFVKFHKLFFVGRSALLQLESQRQHTLVRFQVDQKGQKVSRPGNPVLSAEGQHLGVVTSSTVLKDRQVGMAYISTAHAAEGTAIGIHALGENPAGTGASALPGAPRPGARRTPLLQATIVSRWYSPA